MRIKLSDDDFISLVAQLASLNSKAVIIGSEIRQFFLNLKNGELTLETLATYHLKHKELICQKFFPTSFAYKNLLQSSDTHSFCSKYIDDQ
jgi:hypothetical protein